MIRRPAPLPVAGLAAVVALQFFGGHPESSFHVLAATVVFFGFRLLVLRRAGALAGCARRCSPSPRALVGGAALAAVALLPFLELLSRSSDVDVRRASPRSPCRKQYLLGFALYDYWGRATHTAVGGLRPERALLRGRAAAGARRRPR